jgi:hypothetical protein
MPEKPTTAEGYPSGLAEEARRMALYVATMATSAATSSSSAGSSPNLIVDQA